MDFTGTGKTLTPEDLTSAADFLRTDVATIKAIIRIEAPQGGFGKDLRPTILYEPHKFYQFVTGAARQKAMRLGLAYPAWGMKPYPKTQRERYELQLLPACLIDETAAIKATSWGLGQVMGFNFLLVGCATPQQVVEESKKGEGAQLLLMLRYIKSLLLDKHLRERNWAAFAKAYNGKEFAKHKYDERLAAAYKEEVIA